MSWQPEIQFNPKRSEQLAEAGLSLAVETANKEHKDWSVRCWDLFKIWIGKKEKGFEFLIEDFRSDCYKYKMIEEPKSMRAFGMVSKRAAKEGLVEFVGTRKVKNVTAHSANAGVWKKL